MRTACTYHLIGRHRVNNLEKGFILGFVSLAPPYCSGVVPYAVIETVEHNMITVNLNHVNIRVMPEFEPEFKAHLLNETTPIEET